MTSEAEAPKPKRPTRSPGCGAGDAETAEADDSGAEERGDVGVVEGVGERIEEVGTDEGVLGVASVDGVAGEDGVVAEVFFVATAEGAGAVGATDPGDSYAGVERQFEGGSVDDLAYDLVTEDERLVGEWAGRARRCGGRCGRLRRQECGGVCGPR